MSVLRWRVWYDGARMFDSREVVWEDLPDDGLQLVVVFLPRGERIVSGCDFYFKAGDTIGGNCDSVNSIRERYPGASVKRGRWASDEEHLRLERLARGLP